MKKTSILAAVLAATALISHYPLFSLEKPSFSGFAGILGSIANDFESDDFDIEVSNETFFAGQIDFSNKLLIRGEMYVASHDIFGDFLDDIQEYNAAFKIEELSATYRLNGTRTSHYLSFFLGNYQPIGSDIFLQRHFGILPIASKLAESWHGLSGSSIYPFYAIGGSYVAKNDSNLAFGVSFYKNKIVDSTGEEISNLIPELRFATVQNKFTMDFSAGLSFPLEDSDDDDNLFVVKQIQLQLGLNMLIGNIYTTSVFLQGGLCNFVIKPADDGEVTSPELSNIYAFIEPRFTAKTLKLAWSIFNIPSASATKFLYLRDMYVRNEFCESLLGSNFTIYSDRVFANSTCLTIGGHASFAFTDASFDTFDEIADWNYELYVTPYIEIPLFSGTFATSVTVSCLDMGKPLNAFWVNAGFKTQF